MLVRVEARTRQGALLDMPLEDSSNGLVVQEIEGLDPVKATLVSSSFAQSDGEQYHSSRREARDLKLTLGLEPDYVSSTVQDLRRRLYSFFMPKLEVMLRFHMDDGSYVDIWGRVESFGSPLFTREPAVDISLRCFNPDFFDPNPVTRSEMSTDVDVDILVEYEGTVETGVLFDFAIDRDLTAFTIYHRPPDGTLRTLDFASALYDGDRLRISTSPGAKSAILTRGGSDTSVLYGISPQSNWIELQPGDNHIRVYAIGLGVPYTLEYTNKYGGL